MNPREAYDYVNPVKRIVDAYSAVSAWGGAMHQDGAHAPGTPVVFDAAAVVRDLLIDGNATARVEIRGTSKTVSFEYHEAFVHGPMSKVAVVTSVAQSYAEFAGKASLPSVGQYLKMLLDYISMGLALPLWVLSQNEVRGANVVSLKWALMSFVFGCERYQGAMQRAIQDEFGGAVTWSRELRGKSGLMEYVNTYRAFCDQLGLELTPLRVEATSAAQMLREIPGVISDEEVKRITQSFPPCVDDTTAADDE
jgi:hypothetical protein